MISGLGNPKGKKILISVLFSFLLLIGVTTVLSMTTMGFGGRSQMPKVSYATALDWFVILCFSFVFAVMVEYAAINFIDKMSNDLKKALDAKKKEAEKEAEVSI